MGDGVDELVMVIEGVDGVVEDGVKLVGERRVEEEERLWNEVDSAYLGRWWPDLGGRLWRNQVK